MAGKGKGKFRAGLVLLIFFLAAFAQISGTQDRSIARPRSASPDKKVETSAPWATVYKAPTAKPTAQAQRATATPKPTVKRTATPRPTARPTATPSPHTVPPWLASASLQPGDNNDAILQVKQRMQQLGYFRQGAELSGNYNSTMTERVIQFQANNNLPQTGRIDSAFLKALYGPMPVTGGMLADSTSQRARTASASGSGGSAGKSGSGSSASQKKTAASKEEKANPAALPSGRYYASKKSNVYHVRTCRYINQINDSNLISFSSKEEAISKGYRACKVCHPR